VAADEPLLDVAAALADGKAVDWESAAQSITDDEDRRLLAELRFIGVARPTPADASGSVPRAAALPSTGSPGDTWGPLKMIEHVGRGTFGDVYRAWGSRLDREVALKILRRRERDDPTHASTVIEEGRLLARVRHPNVVTVYGAERTYAAAGRRAEAEAVAARRKDFPATLIPSLPAESPCRFTQIPRLGEHHPRQPVVATKEYLVPGVTALGSYSTPLHDGEPFQPAPA
jgi:Protein kinase domain